MKDGRLESRWKTYGYAFLYLIIGIAIVAGITYYIRSIDETKFDPSYQEEVGIITGEVSSAAIVYYKVHNQYPDDLEELIRSHKPIRESVKDNPYRPYKDWQVIAYSPTKDYKTFLIEVSFNTGKKANYLFHVELKGSNISESYATREDQQLDWRVQEDLWAKYETKG